MHVSHLNSRLCLLFSIKKKTVDTNIETNRSVACKTKTKKSRWALDILGENVMLVEIRLSAEGSAADRANIWALAKMRGRNMLIEQVKMAVSRVALGTRVRAQTVVNSFDMLCPVPQNTT